MCATILLRTGHRDHNNYPELARLMIIKLIAAAGGYYPHYVTLRSRVTCHVAQRQEDVVQSPVIIRGHHGHTHHTVHALHCCCLNIKSQAYNIFLPDRSLYYIKRQPVSSMSTSLHTKPVQSEHVSPVPDKYDNWILHKSDGGRKYIRWPEVVLAE